MAWDPKQWWNRKRRELLQFRGEDCQACAQSASSRSHGSGRDLIMIPSVKEVAEATIDSLTHHERHGQTAEEEERLALARDCTDAGVKAGVKAGSYACVGSAIPTLIAARTIPWAKHNLNYTGQALIISACTIAAYFITAEQTILACSRDASYARLEKKREAEGR